MKTNHRLALACLAASLSLQLAAFNCGAQPAAAVNMPQGVVDVVKLVKAGINEDVILAQIRSAGAYYNLSADQILFLRDQGVSQSEIRALLGPGDASPAEPVAPAPATPARPSAPPAPAPALAPVRAAPAPAVALSPAEYNLAVFQTQLSPFGSWLEVPGYGMCWRPTIAATNPFWRPYCDAGHWIYTDDGWYWQSDYSWGAIVFHYGRWDRAGALGWVWIPAYDWAPAWVCWRQTDGYCGWAPLPPKAVFRPGIGLWFNGRLASDADFGLSVNLFTFVPYDRFWERNVHRFIVPRDRVEVVFRRSTIINGYRFERGRFRVLGIGRERMAALTRHEIRVEAAPHHWEPKPAPGGQHGPLAPNSRKGPNDWNDRNDRNDRHDR